MSDSPISIATVPMASDVFIDLYQRRTDAVANTSGKSAQAAQRDDIHKAIHGGVGNANAEENRDQVWEIETRDELGGQWSAMGSTAEPIITATTAMIANEKSAAFLLTKTNQSHALFKVNHIRHLPVSIERQSAFRIILILYSIFQASH